MLSPITSLLITSISLLLNLTHPLSLLGFIVLITILLSCKMLLTFNSSWMPLLLIMSMLGGLMILFIYMISLAPNEQFKTNKPTKWVLLILAITVILPTWQLKLSQTISVNYIWTLTWMITIMATYLFATLITLIFLVQMKKGPLRT